LPPKVDIGRAPNADVMNDAADVPQRPLAVHDQE